MTEPLDTLQENEEKGTQFDVLELFDESESEDESEDLDVGEDLHDFLTITIKGPQLDEQMVGLLFNNGVEGSSFIFVVFDNTSNDWLRVDLSARRACFSVTLALSSSPTAACNAFPASRRWERR